MTCALQGRERHSGEARMNVDVSAIEDMSTKFTAVATRYETGGDIP